MFACARCGVEVKVSDRISRTMLCPNCGAYLHSCVNCKFYSPGSHNDCREPQADLVSDKKSSNFCEYFSPGDKKRATQKKGEKRNARDRFDQLFGE